MMVVGAAEAVIEGTGDLEVEVVADLGRREVEGMAEADGENKNMGGVCSCYCQNSLGLLSFLHLYLYLYP